MNIYDNDSRPLEELLHDASTNEGATLLVPDLQRPYVWSPNQVSMLVDSLLRGWPFATLLLWDVKDTQLGTIPSRPFWRIVDRTEDGLPEERVATGHPPQSFRMVLDGQQRLQSLLLAFGGDSFGFRLTDRDWADELHVVRPKGRNSRKHWSLGGLCLDLWTLEKKLVGNPGLEHVDFRDVLRWVVTSPQGLSLHRRPTNYRPVLPRQDDTENAGRYLRLSRLWSLARRLSTPFPQRYKAPLTELLNQHHVPAPTRDALIDPLSELAMVLFTVKQQKVSYLILKAHDPEQIAADVYNDAIVNIFTRLNSAGRALTRQEITFAWLKSGWDTALTGGRTAGACFETLQKELREKGSEVWLDLDELVASISIMWSVLKRDGQLLKADDLLRNEHVGPMARAVAERWQTLAENAKATCQLVHDRDLVQGKHFQSLNVLTLLVSLRLLGREWLERGPGAALKGTDKDHFEKQLDQRIAAFADRWLILSQWSGRWAQSTDKVLATYVAQLAADWKAIAPETKLDAVLGALDARIGAWLEALRADATAFIDNIGEAQREAVKNYWLPLWLWHRLDADRWAASKIQLREERKRAVSLEVDHVVAVKFWESLPLAPPGEGDGEQQDLSEVVNALGNTCLLEKTFNIGKSARPLKAFLLDVSEFRSGGSWTVPAFGQALGLPNALVDPARVDRDALVAAIEARTAEMKRALKTWVTGASERADLGEGTGATSPA